LKTNEHFCQHYRLTFALLSGGQPTASVIVSIFDRDRGRVAILTQPEKLIYDGPPLPIVLKDAITAVLHREGASENAEQWRWIAHFNRKSYFEETNVKFNPEFCDVTVSRIRGAASSAELGRQISAREIAAFLNVPERFLYEL
jgi:hypothetical protein